MNIEVYRNQTIDANIDYDNNKIWQIIRDIKRNLSNQPTSYDDSLLYIVSTGNDILFKKSLNLSCGFETKDSISIIHIPAFRDDNGDLFTPTGSVLFKMFYSNSYNLLDQLKSSILDIINNININKIINLKSYSLSFNSKTCGYIEIIKNTTGFHIYGSLLFSNTNIDEENTFFNKEFGITNNEFINQFIESFSLKFKNLYPNENINIKEE